MEAINNLALPGCPLTAAKPQFKLLGTGDGSGRASKSITLMLASKLSAMIQMVPSAQFRLWILHSQTLPTRQLSWLARRTSQDLWEQDLFSIMSIWAAKS